MQPSLTLCRTREAHHLALAGAATLANVRLIANAAAAAWAKEGLAAEHRESRKLRDERPERFGMADAEPPSEYFFGLSENPDRGHAGAA